MGQNKIKVPAGFLLTGVASGIARKKGKLDLGIIYAEVPCVTAAVFTTNTVKAAPVLLSSPKAKAGGIRAVVANSGNANACTGKQGLNDARESARLVAAGLAIKPEKVIVASTGVIGVPLPMEKMRQGIKLAVSRISTGSLNDFSKAIMTTDTVPKIKTVKFTAGGKTINIAGIAKGSGMIHPNMATMLVFIMTDARIDNKSLQSSLSHSVNRSFNMLTVDGDTSTNDMVLVLASGEAGNKAMNGPGKELDIFRKNLDIVCLELAKMIARDGEGASKFVQVSVKGAKNFAAAKQVAMSIARSSLVKTALFGNDPNWGRIIAAIGYSGVAVDPEAVDISLASRHQKILMCRNGRDPGFSESKAKKIMQNKDLEIQVNLKQGPAQATVFTCDLTHGYIDINASYRT
jgi:glutamate N-acetyltransferase / amino-acid N-acetyltransferase